MDDCKFPYNYYYQLKESNLMDFDLKTLSELRYKIEDSISKKISYELDCLVRGYEFEDNHPMRTSTDLFGYDKYKSIDERIKTFLDNLIKDNIICKYQYNISECFPTIISVRLSLDGIKYLELSSYAMNFRE